jgi:hypothetical protein
MTARRILSPVLIALLAFQQRAGVANADDAQLRQQVLSSIQSAQDFIISRQQGDGSFGSIQSGSYKAGVAGLAVLALLNSGRPADDPAVAKGLDFLRRMPEPVKVYDLGMAIQALAAAKTPKRDAGRIAQFAKLLEEAQNTNQGPGSWGYQQGDNWWDNSNTQFAVLGLREASYSGYQVRPKVWELTRDHWLQNLEGSATGPTGSGWSYKSGGAGGGTSGSMTVAGIASLSIVQGFLQNDERDVLPSGEIDCCGNLKPDPVEVALEGSVRWMSRNISVTTNPGGPGHLLYYLYGLERAGRFTGTRFFGEKDWYREGASFLVRGQNLRDGSYPGALEESDVVATSLALLFLSKGLAPVVVNKLKYGPRDAVTGDVADRSWNRHTRDINNLVDYIVELPKWPKLMTWQSVDLDVAANGEGVDALLQAPVQFLSGDQDLSTITKKQTELLKDYIAQGGFLFISRNCDSANFDTDVRRFVRELLPSDEYRLERLLPTHDIYRSEFTLTENPPELWGVDFGCRTAIVYSPFDLGCRWNKWARFDPPGRQIAVTTQITRSMRLGTNIIAYATGREVHDKLRRQESLAKVDTNQLERGRLKIARVRHGGGWDAAPHALRHLQSALTTVGLEASVDAPSVALTDPALFDHPVLYMHGRKSFALSPEEIEKLKEYLQNGGFLFADACCGASQFDESFRRLISQVMDKPLARIPVTHEMFHPDLGHDIRQVRRRAPAADAQPGAIDNKESVGEPFLEGIEIDGRYAVVYSKYDISCALERQSTPNCLGYVGEDAVKIAVDVVLYALYR